jgi:hypothetical protein
MSSEKNNKKFPSKTSRLKSYDEEKEITINVRLSTVCNNSVEGVSLKVTKLTTSESESDDSISCKTLESKSTIVDKIDLNRSVAKLNDVIQNLQFKHESPIQKLYNKRTSTILDAVESSKKASTTLNLSNKGQLLSHPLSSIFDKDLPITNAKVNKDLVNSSKLKAKDDSKDNEYFENDDVFAKEGDPLSENQRDLDYSHSKVRQFSLSSEEDRVKHLQTRGNLGLKNVPTNHLKTVLDQKSKQSNINVQTQATNDLQHKVSGSTLTHKSDVNSLPQSEFINIKPNNKKQHELKQSVCTSDDNNAITFSSNKKDPKIASGEISNTAADILNKDIQIKMRIIKESDEQTSSFYLLENEMEKEFISPEMPNVLFKVRKQYLNDENTRIDIKIREIDCVLGEENSEGKLREEENLVGHFDLIMRPDQRVKELNFPDELQNDIKIRLKKESN